MYTVVDLFDVYGNGLLDVYGGGFVRNLL